MNKVSIIFCLLLFTSVGFTSSLSRISNNFTQPHQSVAKRVSKEEFLNKMKSLQTYQLIDVRTPNEFSNGTIKGAKNINYKAADFEKQLLKLDKSIPTLIFCHSGGRSAMALKKMNSLGFEYVLELQGGYSAWSK